MCSDNKSEENGANRNKSEQIGVFPKTRSASRNKSEENGEERESKRANSKPAAHRGSR